MMLISDINARLGEIDAELETLAALTDPTAEDAARSEALELEAVEVRQARVEALERRERITEAFNKAKAAGTEIRGASFEHKRTIDPYDVDMRNMDADQLADSARSILDRVEARHLEPDQKAKVENLVGRHGERVSRMLIATSRPQYRSAWMKYVTGNSELLTNDERRAVAEVRGTQMVLADANGGYAVPALLDPTVILTSAGTTNPMRQISRIVTGIDDTWRGVSSAGVTASWDSEAIEVSEDGPTLAQPTVVSHKAQAFVSFSVELEGDWVGIAGELSDMFADAKDTLEEAAFSTGSAADAPIGILTALFAGSAVTAVTVTTDGQFGAVDVRNAFGALGPRYRRNASFVASIDVLNEIRAFDTTGGLSNQTVDLTAPYSFALLGKPVYENSGFPAFTGTTGAANILVVGDFRNYVIFDRIGSRTEFVPHLFATGSNRPNGTRGLLFWWRVGADSVNDAGFKLLLNT